MDNYDDDDDIDDDDVDCFFLLFFTLCSFYFSSQPWLDLFDPPPLLADDSVNFVSAPTIQNSRKRIGVNHPSSP